MRSAPVGWSDEVQLMANPGRTRHNTEILSMLLEKADVQGYLTTEDLIEVYPDVSGDAERMEAILMALRRRGIESSTRKARQITSKRRSTCRAVI